MDSLINVLISGEPEITVDKILLIKIIVIYNNISQSLFD